ncbi:MAG: ABC transporter permease [Clostridia bacterium]
MMNLQVKLTESMFEKAGFNEKEADNIGYSNYSYWRSTIRTFFKSPISKTLVILAGLFVLMAFFYPMFTSVDPIAPTIINNPELANNAPSAEHIFGTDNLGRDMWTRTWYGTRTSLLLGFVVAFFDITIGVIMGALWGYVEKMDRIMTEIYNVLVNIPQTIYLVLFTYIFTPGFWTIVLAMCVTGWLSVAMFIRNKVVAIRRSEYNIASRCLGTPLGRILSKNILPNLVSLIIMQTALTIPMTIGSEVFLGYIGLGLPGTSVVSLGDLISTGRAVFRFHSYQLWFPTLILSIITISFYVLGNRFADASDPKNHV